MIALPAPLRRSLRLRMASLTVICIGLLSALYLFGATRLTSRVLATELEREATSRMRLVADHAAPLLQHFDHLGLVQWLDTLMLLPGVDGVEVRSDDEWTLAMRGEPRGTPLHQVISRDQQSLGSMTVFLNPGELHKKVRIVTMIGLAAVFLGLPLVFALIWLFSTAFLRDLLALADRAEQIGNVVDLQLPGRGRDDEVGRLARLLEHRSREIREGHEEMRLLNKAIEQASEAVVITDREGGIRYVNPAFSRITGYSPDEVLGENPRILKSNRHDEQFYRDMWKTLAEGRSWSGRIINRRKNGRDYEEELSISPIHSEDGAVSHYVAVKRDVSAELLLERHLRQAQRLEAVGTLAGGIAHEFNNILTVIRGNLELLLYRLTPDNPLYPQLKDMQQSAGRAADLVRQLMLFSRQTGGGGQQVRIDNVVRGMHSLLQSLVGERIRLLLEMRECRPIMLEPGLLELMVTNLVHNARDAIDGPGEITVQVANRSYDDDTAKGSVRPGSFVMLSVRDSGRGMTAEVMEQLFDPFFSTKDTVPGRGLGLAVVYGLVRQLDGWIEVESTLGQGSELRIYLPAMEQEQQTGSGAIVADPLAQSMPASQEE